MDTFTCRVCKETKDTSLAQKGSLTKIGTGRCKACHSEYCKNHHLKKKVAMSPQNHFQCDDCDRYMNVFDKGKHTGKLIDKCKYCGSKNIEDII